jgi:hypothetical protein
MHDKRSALDILAKHVGLYREETNIAVNVDLLDLVNGSYELERRKREAGELVEPPLIDAKPLPEQKNQ